MTGIANTADSLLTVSGLILSVLLIAVLALKELLRAYGGPSVKVRMRTLTIIVTPLLFSYLATVTVRLLLLIN